MTKKYSHEELIRLYMHEVIENDNVDVAEEIIHPNFRNSFPNTSLKWGWLTSINRFQYLDSGEEYLGSKNSDEIKSRNPIRQALIDITRGRRDQNDRSINHKFTIKKIVIGENSGSVFYTHHYKFFKQPSNLTAKFMLNTEADGDAVMFFEFQDNKIIALDFIADYLSVYYSLNATFLNFDQLKVVDNYLQSLGEQ